MISVLLNMRRAFPERRQDNRSPRTDQSIDPKVKLLMHRGTASSVIHDRSHVFPTDKGSDHRFTVGLVRVGINIHATDVLPSSDSGNVENPMRRRDPIPGAGRAIRREALKLVGAKDIDTPNRCTRYAYIFGGISCQSEGRFKLLHG